MEDSEFPVDECDLWDVPNIGPALMLLPSIESIALRLLPCEEVCNHLSCNIDRINVIE